MKNSSYYIAPVGDRTHDLPHTIASNMGKVSHALNHSATAAVKGVGLALHSPVINDIEDYDWTDLCKLLIARRSKFKQKQDGAKEHHHT